MGQKDNNFIKGTLGNKKNQSNNRKQNETKIEIELNENQINNTNYDVQSCNDDEASNSKRINDEKDFDKNHEYDDDEEKQDVKGEATDSDVPDLINRLDDPEDQNRAYDSDRDSDSDNDDDVDSMKHNSGFLNGMEGIFKRQG